MNAIPDSTNATLKIDSTTIASSLGYPFMSDPVNISALTDNAQHALELTTTPSATWNGTSTLASGNSFVFFGVGSIANEIKVARRTLPLDYTVPAGKVLVTIVDGYTAAPVDFYVLPSGETPNGTNKTATLNFQQTLKLQPELDAGTYKIFATTQGDPNDIIAQSSAIALPTGELVDYVLVSSSAQGTTFITTFEN
jgi:hypothetical protein